MPALAFVSSHARRLLSAAALLAACGALGPAPASAQPAAGAPPAAVATGARNIYAGGGDVRTQDVVRGDFVAAGGRVVADQPIAGDAMLAGGAVEVRAAIGDDLRVIGGDVHVDGSVGGELLASGGHIQLGRGASVAGSATLMGGSLLVQGRIGGPLRAMAQRIVVDGEVAGDARLSAEDIELGPQARIAGTLRYDAKTEPRRAPGAFVGGAVVRDAGPVGEPVQHQRRAADRPWQPLWWPGGLAPYLALLAVGALALLLAPRYAEAAADRLAASVWLALGGGVAAVAALPVVAVLLCLTVLGIPLGLGLLALAPALLLAGVLTGVHALSRQAAVALHRPRSDTPAARIGTFAIGLLLVLLASRIPVVGAMALALLSLAGLGASVLACTGRGGGLRAPLAQAQQPPPGSEPPQGATAQT